MKLPVLHKYFSINIFFYLIFTQSILSIFFWLFITLPIDIHNICILFIALANLIFIINFLLTIPMNMFVIFIEFILRKFNKLKSCNEITISPKQQKIVYLTFILACAIVLAFLTYSFTHPTPDD